MHHARLLEREGELAHVERVIGRVAGGSGRTLLVEGVAGIGKTQLLTALRTRADAAGFRIARAGADELERDLTWGVVRQLFEPIAVKNPALLEGAAAIAAPLLGLGDAPAPPAADPALATLHGLYWLAANASVEAPLVVVMDDAQWADHASLRFLAYLSRRIEELPILIAVAVRAEALVQAPPALSALSSYGDVERMAPAPLSEAAVGSLVDERLGAGDRTFARTCHAATGGNPFLVNELLRDLERAGVEPRDAARERVAELRPESVRRSVASRLSELGGGALALARAAAVLGAASLLHAAAALAGLDPDDAATIAAQLGAAGILAPGLSLTFAHPLVRAAVYDSWPAPERARAHRRAAELLAEAGAASDRIAAQLLFAPPAADRWVVGRLREAAAEAARSGDATTACRLLRRALEEPPAPGEVADVEFELGRVEAALRDPEGLPRLRRALEAAGDPQRRAALALALGEALVYAYDMGSAVEVLDGALADPELPPDAELRMEIARYAAARTVIDNGAGPDGRLEALAERIGDPPPLLAIRASAANLRGAPADDVGALLDRALADPGLVPAVIDSPLAMVIANTLMWTDQLDRALVFFDSLLAEARRRGSVLGYMAITYRSDAAYRAGRLLEAEADAREALALVEEHGFGWDVQGTTAFLAQALLERGAADAALALLEAPGMEPLSPSRSIVLHVQGRALLALGRVGEAVAALRECGDIVTGWEMGNPTLTPWRSTLALALQAGGETEGARELAERQLADARRIGAPRALGISLRVAGIVTGRRVGEGLMREAVAVLEETEARLELAHSLAALGCALRDRRAGDEEARALLERALDLAHRCDASALRNRVHRDLVALGARPRRYAMTGREALTAAEARVAGLAANGMVNRDIAQALFVTEKTVEKHLTNAYAKLGIASRDALTDALAA